MLLSDNKILTQHLFIYCIFHEYYLIAQPMLKFKTITCSLFLIVFASCNISQKSKSFSEMKKPKVNLLHDYPSKFDDGDINVVIEIPAGTLEKWEVNKSTGRLEWDKVDGVPRVINYLSYPGNYGMIPKTLLSKESGGDGDPLDVILLGPSVDKGTTVKSKLIGVLYLIDKGEQDDKLIAVSTNSPIYNVNDLTDLDKHYKGVSEILKLWFTNYKGASKIDFNGFGTKKDAEKILEEAIKQYLEKNKRIKKV